MAIRTTPNPNRCRPRSGEYMMVEELGGFVTIFFAARALDMEYGCIDSAAKRGKIRFARLGNERLFRLEDVAAYKARREAETATRKVRRATTQG